MVEKLGAIANTNDSASCDNAGMCMCMSVHMCINIHMTSLSTSDLSSLAHALSTNIMVWPPSDSDDPILVKPRVSKFGAKCYNVGVSKGAFAPKRGR